MIAGVSRRDLIRKFRALGYAGPFSGGKHQFMKRDTKKIRIPNPHGNADISVSLLKEILKQAGIKDSEWNEA
jgi:predicted RNA binding protein YcfA (HicA-like mRNA interferase family)